jgi:predicted dehydrogenase
MVEQPNPVGVAIIGYGHWGRNHARVLSELEDSAIVVICDESMDRLEEAGKRFPAARLTTSVDEVFATSNVDAVIVCTPATTHFDVTRRCLAAGKHVLAEKPFTTNSQDGQILSDLAANAGLTLMVGQTFLFNQGIMKLNDVILSGEIGRIHYMYARRTNLGPIRKDVNALWDLAPHDISIFNYFMGTLPLWVSAVGAPVLGNHLEDVGFITLVYPGNILAHIHVSWSDPNKVREVVVVGSRQRVLFNDVDTVEQVRIFEKGVEAVGIHEADARSDLTYGELRLLVRDGDIRSPRLPAEEPLKRECKHFLDCMRTGVPSTSGGPEGTDVVRVMEAIDASLARRGAPVELQRARIQVTGTNR